MAVQAFDLAERLQTPVFVLSDLDIGMNDWMCPDLQWDDAYRPDRGKILSPEELAGLEKFYRYVDRDDDAITYRTLPGIERQGRLLHARLGPQSIRRLHRGFRRIPGRARSAEAKVRECAEISAQARDDGEGRQRSRDRERRQLRWRDSRSARRARDGRKSSVDYLRVKAFPFNSDVEAFLKSHSTIFVVEQNRDAQLKSLLTLETAVEKSKLLFHPELQRIPDVGRAHRQRHSSQARRGAAADGGSRARPESSTMSYINKPKVAHPSLPTNTLGMTRRQYEGSMSTLCAGCGHDSVTASDHRGVLGALAAPRTAGEAVRHRLFIEDHRLFRGRFAWIQFGARPHALDRERGQCRQSAPHLRRRIGRRRFALHRHRSIGARDPPQREHAVFDRKQRRLRSDQGTILGLRRYRHQGEARRRQFLAADRSGVAGADLGRDLRRAQLLRRQGAARAADSSRDAPQRLRPDRRALALRDLQRSRGLDQELHFHARALPCGGRGGFRAAGAGNCGRLCGRRVDSR